MRLRFRNPFSILRERRLVCYYRSLVKRKYWSTPAVIVKGFGQMGIRSAPSRDDPFWVVYEYGSEREHKVPTSKILDLDTIRVLAGYD